MALDSETKTEITDAVNEAFSAEGGTRRFIDLSRVPLICQSIVGIDEKLKEIKDQMVTKDQFWPVKTLVYGFVSIVLTAVILGIVYLVVKVNGIVTIA